MASRKPPSRIRLRKHLFLLVCGLGVMAGCGQPGDGDGGAASAKLRVMHGARIELTGPQQSINWCGYQLSGLPLGFTQVRGTWIVPSIEQSGSETASSSWVGIGGGCANPPNCAIDDPTLIQAGTEQDFFGGSAQYSAWWEAIPAPEIPLSGGPLSRKRYDVLAGDQITVTIDGSDLVVWNIDIRSVRANHPHWEFTTTVPYTAAGLTAEWIEELPLVIGGNGRNIGLSNFGQLPFGDLFINNLRPTLSTQDAIVLVNSNGGVLASPSLPKPGPSFDVCYASSSCE